MTGDEALKMALIAYSEEYFSQYDVPADEKPHRFSLAYRIRKKSITRLAKKHWERPASCAPYKPSKILAAERSYIPLKKLAVIISVIISAVFFTVAAGAIYFGARGFIFDVYNTHSNVSVDFSMYDIKDTIEEVYRLPVESGYECVDEILDKWVVSSRYKLGDKTVNFVQYTKSFAENLMVNTENSTVSEIKVNGEVGFILYHQNKYSDNTASITWIQNGYVFEIMGADDDSEELLRLAEIIEIE